LSAPLTLFNSFLNSFLSSSLPKEEIIQKQIEKVDGISNYNGQLIHIKKDEAFVYSLSDLNTVLSEALLESNSQTFRSRGSET